MTASPDTIAMAVEQLIDADDSRVIVGDVQLVVDDDDPLCGGCASLRAEVERLTTDNRRLRAANQHAVNTAAAADLARAHAVEQLARCMAASPVERIGEVRERKDKP